MKLTLLLFLAFFACAKFSVAQTEYIVQVDTRSGDMKKMRSIPGVGWIRIATHVYNPVKKQYSFIGMNSDESEVGLYTVSGVSGEIVHKAVLDQPRDDNPINFAHDPNSGNMYGIYWNAARQEEYFVRVNEEAGTFDSLSLFPGIKWVAGNTQCINTHTNQYTFLGLDSLFREKYCTVNITTGEVMLVDIAPIYDSASVLIMKYDATRKKYFAVVTSAFQWKTGIDEVNIITGQSERIAQLPPFQWVGQTRYTYNEKDGLFYMGVGKDTTDTDWLYSIGVADGRLARETVLPLLPENDNLISYEYDADLDKMIALHWEASSNQTVDSISIYPIPADKTLQIDLKKYYDHLGIVMTDMSGRIVMRENYRNTSMISLNTGALANASYLLAIVQGNSILHRRKILVWR